MAEVLFIGDDFTGASDTLATLAERGLRTRLFLDVPRADVGAGEQLDAVGLATDLRTRTPEEIAYTLRRLAPALSAISPRFVHYKVCSTFDSSVDAGSIGAAILALEQIFRHAATVVFGGQPSLKRYCVFGHLFAGGPDGTVHRIDRHPVMSQHPVTPMAESDLRLHLSAQGLKELQLVARDEIAALSERLLRFEHGARFLIDGLEQTDIERAGNVVRSMRQQHRPVLLVGASGVAEAIAAHRDAADDTVREPAARTGTTCLVLAGSRSSVTATQVASARSYTRISLVKSDLFENRERTALHCVAELSSGRNVLVHLDPTANYQESPTQLSHCIAELAVAIVERHSVGGLCVAGGDTSSAVVRRLGFESLAFETRIAPGLALCRGRFANTSSREIKLLLKGGQVGTSTVFDDFAHENYRYSDVHIPKH